MLTKNALTSIVILIGIQLLANAQSTSKDEIPKAPEGILLKNAPEFSSWLETYIYPVLPLEIDPTQEEQRLSLVKKILITKTRDVCYQLFTYNSDRKTEKWQVGSNVFLRPSNQNYWSVYGSGYNKDMIANVPELAGIAESGAKELMFKRFEGVRNPETTPLPASGFTDLEWVGSSTYVGQATDKEREYLLFVPQGLNFKSYNKISSVRSMPIYAIVDSQTRLPLESKKDGVIKVYQFLAPPADKLNLPTDLIRELKEGQEKLEKAFAMPPRGY